LDLEFLKESADEQDKASRRAKDIELWDTWKANGQKPEDLKPLFNAFKGTIRSKVNTWSNRVEVPPTAIHAEFNKQFVHALQTYDPNKGANLKTWVDRTLNKGNRWVGSYQNIARIPETRSHGTIREFKSAKLQLDESLGREPTHFEVAEHLGWSPKTVETLDRELRKSYVSSGFQIDPVSVMPSPEAEALYNVYYDLTPEEQLVYDYTVGAHGKPELKPMQIAETLNMSRSKVSNLRNSITSKLRKHL
jgi:DNA-directed RNA polymerase specialized sigma subunit